MRFVFALTTLFSSLGKPFFVILIALLQITQFIGFILLRVLEKSWLSFAGRLSSLPGFFVKIGPVVSAFLRRLPGAAKRLAEVKSRAVLQLARASLLKRPKIFLPKLSWRPPGLPVPKKMPRVRAGRPALFIFVFFLSGISFYFWILKDLPSPEDLANHRPFLTTKIYDQKGRLLYKIYREENRTLVFLDELPPLVIGATLAAEDSEFWNHLGISWRGIVRAAWFDINNPDQEPIGGSTITQQLVKNVFFGPEKTVQRKLKEVVLSFLVEMRFSKKQILQMYLNQIPYGGTAYGVEEASQKYFSQSARDLTLAQAAMLAGFPRAPTRYSPFGSYPDLAKRRQRQVLSQMLKNGYISQEEYQKAVSESLRFNLQDDRILAPHFVFYIKGRLIERYGRRMVEQGGLSVATSLDLDVQREAEKVLREELVKVAGLRVGNGAILVINPKTGEVLAMVGSKDYFDFENDGNVNVVLRLRQPGSAIKPINYAVALQKGFTPMSVINDAPVSFRLPGQKPYAPINYDNRFHGKVTLRTALGSSLNVPAVKMLAIYGVDKMAQMGREMGINSWEDSSRFGLSLTLGGGEVKMTELATAYGVLANLGKKVEINPILKVAGPTGGVLYQREKDLGKPALDPGVAFLLDDILSDDTARSVAFGRHSMLEVPGAKVAVKTGTTNDLRDNWAVGYTPRFLVAVWVGNNDNSPMSGVASGITGATPIWRRMTDYLLALYPSQGWLAPGNVVKTQVCPQSGTLSCSACPSPRWEYFIKGSLPKRACSSADFAPLPTPFPTSGS